MSFPFHIFVYGLQGKNILGSFVEHEHFCMVHFVPRKHICKTPGYSHLTSVQNLVIYIQTEDHGLVTSMLKGDTLSQRTKISSKVMCLNLTFPVPVLWKFTSSSFNTNFYTRPLLRHQNGTLSGRSSKVCKEL